MSYFEGLPFFVCLVAVLVVAAVIGWMEKPLRWYGFAASLLFVAFVFGGCPQQLLYLLLFYLWSMALILLYERIRRKQGRKAGIYRVMVLLSLVPLVCCKVSPLFHGNIFAFTGVSYLTFRVVQMLIELYDGVIKEVSAVETTAFLVFFPSLSSGPIDRSRRFLQDWERTLPRETYMDLCAKGIWKLLLGAVYKMVLAAGAYKAMGYLETGTMWYHWIGYAYAYGMYLFFDFAGYSLMAVGSSYILGVEMPDNFRMPFISKDIREFWDRWHITLSHWFRDFIFTRFIMYSSKKKWFSSRLQRACAGFFVNMGIMGIWHGLSLSYILYGLYHGALLALTEVYQKKSSFYKRHRKEKWYQAVSWAVTMQLVMFGFFLFSGKLVSLLG
ncbi:MAG: D-alanyl-lipoteichoic acid biosynthesis protein DltB [Candidatus Choladocola sp.]|nr:D-alanyl-lipoteichoic acid biosynthesis protein DltB [Candidatus Choladocola sp.]